MSVVIGERIRALRTERGLSQEEVARRTGVSLGSYGDIERGVTTDPHYSTLRGIARALGVPIEKLLQEEPALAGKAEAPQETGQSEVETFEEMMARERRGDLTDAAIITEYERFVREYRIAWRDALENLVEPWEGRLASPSRAFFSKDMVEQFFDDVAAVSPSVARALKTGVTESLLHNRYRQAPITAEDVEEMHQTSVAHAANRLLDVCERVWDAAAERFSQDELAEARRLRGEVQQT